MPLPTMTPDPTTDVPATAPDALDAAPAGASNRSHRRLRRAITAFAALLLVIAWVAVALSLRAKHSDAIHAELRQNANLADVLEEQTLRVIAAVDQSTLRVREAWGDGRGPVPDMVSLARESGLTPNIMLQLSLIDRDGRLVASNLDPTGAKSHHVDLSSREHVRVHLHPDLLGPDAPRLGPGGLFIGKPVLGKVSHQWTIQVSRRLGAAGAPPSGVVVASVTPDYFEQVYSRVRLGAGSAVALIGSDRMVRARVLDGRPDGMGTLLPAEGTFSRHARDTASAYIARSGIDGVPRIIALRQVADYPLFVSVATSEHTALAGWRATRDAIVLLGAALTAVVLAAAWNFNATLRRLERTYVKLRQREAEAQAASEAKSAFLAAISHELRTPLTSIRGFAELMEHRLEQPRFREQAGLIRKGAEHLNQLLTEILDLTRIEAGAMPLSPEPTDVRAVVDGTADFFALAAADKGLDLKVSVAPDVPGTVQCDGLRLKQILNNLLSNAVKFTPAGEIRLSVDRQGDTLRFHVADTGPGVPDELHDVIFQKFRQGNARVSYEHGGTGLGLALSRALAERMHGHLGLESPAEGGARFTLSLPLQAGVPPRAAVAPPADVPA